MFLSNVCLEKRFLWENYANLNDIDSNRFPTRSFQGHNLHNRVTPFSLSNNFLLISSI